MKESTRRFKQLRKKAKIARRLRRLEQLECPACDTNEKMKAKRKEFQDEGTAMRRIVVWVVWCNICGCCDYLEDRGNALAQIDVWHKLLDSWNEKGQVPALGRIFFDTLFAAKNRNVSLDVAKLAEVFGWHAVMFAIIAIDKRIKRVNVNGKLQLQWIKKKEKSLKDIDYDY